MWDTDPINFPSQLDSFNARGSEYYTDMYGCAVCNLSPHPLAILIWMWQRGLILDMSKMKSPSPSHPVHSIRLCSLPYGKGSPACPKSPRSPLEHSWLLHPQFVHACINDISLMVVHLLPTSALFWALRISSWPASNNLFTVVPASNFLTPPNHVEYFNQRNISKTQSWLSSLFVSPVTFIIKFSSLTAPKILYLVALNGR